MSYICYQITDFSPGLQRPFFCQVTLPIFFPCIYNRYLALALILNGLCRMKKSTENCLFTFSIACLHSLFSQLFLLKDPVHCALARTIIEKIHTFPRDPELGSKMDGWQMDRRACFSWNKVTAMFIHLLMIDTRTHIKTSSIFSVILHS